MKAFCHIFVKYAQSLGIFSACTLSSGIFSIKQHIFYQTVFHLCFNFGLLIKITVLERILKMLFVKCASQSAGNLTRMTERSGLR